MARGGAVRTEGATRHWSIPSKLALSVAPMAVVTLLLGLFLVWNMVTTDPTAGFSPIDALAIAAGVVVAVVSLGTLLVCYRIGFSMTGRVKAVSAAARRVARKDVIELFDPMRSPDPTRQVPPLNLATDSEDELGDLAHAVEELHVSLVDVSARQVEALRKGVSNIFVTLARRNSTLVDRQLALLDQLEDREEDPEILGGYYQVDHLAARMRRNAESLLVLAGSDSPRMWAKATDISHVIRAAAGEVDEYQRIEVLALEPARLSGGAVIDVVHLLAELMENAAQFSPPSEPVRVTGLFTVGGYQLSISDQGVGMSNTRIAELNRILDRPPALGLTVEPTLGMHVVSKLAYRHGLTVELIRGVPGITAKVTIPRDHLEMVKSPERRPWDPEVESDRPRDQFAYGSAPPPATSESEELIDLTVPAMTEPVVSLRDKRRPTPSTGAETRPGNLPVRTPGLAFRDGEEARGAVVGDGAQSIESALAAYDRGRRAAASGEDSNDTEDPWRDEK